MSSTTMQREKKAVALNSVWAAIGITTLKIVVGAHHRKPGHSVRGGPLGP